MIKNWSKNEATLFVPNLQSKSNPIPKSKICIRETNINIKPADKIAKNKVLDYQILVKQYMKTSLLKMNPLTLLRKKISSTLYRIYV